MVAFKIYRLIIQIQNSFKYFVVVLFVVDLVIFLDVVCLINLKGEIKRLSN